MAWIDLIGRDPVPWLLDPGNPSARYLTLKHIFRKPAAALLEEQSRLLAWRPVAMLRRHWTPTSFWGRATTPYYGGAAGNFGTLYLLTQLGSPPFPEVEPTCESLLEHGRRPDGTFGPGDQAAAPWLSYTGMALQILTHFGYAGDPRTVQGWAMLAQAIADNPDTLGCPVADRGCRAAGVKALGALLHRGGDGPLNSDRVTINTVCHYLLDQPYDWQGRDADWLLARFPRYYDTDLLELGHMLAHTTYRDSSLCKTVIELMIRRQDGEGHWIKAKNTPVFPEERINQPSRWLTFEAVHTLMLTYGDTMYAA
ncbi:MAG: hypothetical protein JXC32_17225 [Anaerolineae bacterium]|nr:hypothetical protein [Anaerolineae bacterium]